jgi:hypothetical protein
VSILSATKFYLDLVMGRRGSEKSTVTAALAALKNEVGGRFPGGVVDAVARVAADEPNGRIDSWEMDCMDLRAGMVLGRDWRNSKDVLLLAAGLVLTETMVRQIQGVALKRMSPIVLAVKPVDAQGRLVERPCRQGGNALAH